MRPDPRGFRSGPGSPAQRLRDEDFLRELRLELPEELFLPELLVERPFDELRDVLRCEREELLLRDLPDPLREREELLRDVLRWEPEPELLFFALFFAEERLRGDGGTFAPSRRASERPIAIACLGLETFFPLRPLLSLPCFISRISSCTFCCALGP